MEIIISHDVDHLYLKEHWKDSYVPGLLLRSFKSIIKGGVSPLKVPGRFTWKLNRVKELREYNKSLGINETYFFGMRNGLNLSYKWNDAKPFIDYLLNENILIGLHGMGYDNKDLLKEEKERIKTMLPDDYPLGIRNHYLRLGDQTLTYMNELGFAYDSTRYELSDPWKIGDMWEIPISVMDSRFINLYKNNSDELKKRSLELLKEAEGKNLNYFVINFHDPYFNNSFPDYINWYKWLTSYLHSNNYRFINFIDALNKLNNSENSLHK